MVEEVELAGGVVLTVSVVVVVEGVSTLGFCFGAPEINFAFKPEQQEINNKSSNMIEFRWRFIDKTYKRK